MFQRKLHGMLRSGLGKSVINMVFGQGLIYATSIAQITWMTSVFPPHAYGILAFGQTLLSLSLFWTAYAVNNTGVMGFRTAAGPDARRAVFGEQLSAQLMLQAAIIPPLFLAIIATDMRADWPVYLVVCASMIGNILWPAWVMVALERFRVISLVNTLLRVMSLVLLLAFVRHREQLLEAALCLFAPQLLILPVAWWHMRGLDLLRTRDFSLAAGWRVIQRDFHIALMNWINFAFTSLPVFLAKSTLDPSQFGLYAFADRFRALCAGFLGVIAMVFYSRFCSHLRTDVEHTGLARFGRLSLAAIVGLGALMGLALLATTEPIIHLLGSRAYLPSFRAVQTLALAVPFAAFNYFIGYFILPTYRLSRIQTALTVVALILGALAGLGGLATSAAAVAAIVLMLEAARALASVALLRLAGVRLLALKQPAPSAGASA